METTYTQNEIKMIHAFYNISVDCCGACDDDQNMSYANAKDLQKELGGTMQEIGGTMSSLESKGAICDQQESARGDRLNDFTLNPSNVENVTKTF